MKKIITLLTSSLIVMQNLYATTSIKDFINDFPKEDISILESSFQDMLKSDNGYVLYGHKPMAIDEVKTNRDYLCSEPGWITKLRTFEILKEWNLATPDRAFNFLLCEQPESLHLIIINRNEFLKVVNDNIELFRYILGMTDLTAEKFLTEILNHQDQIYNIIKDDDALTGILLGYGTKNSIKHHRKILISHSLNFPKTEFPFALNNSLNKPKPSWGFNSLDQELLTVSEGSLSQDILSHESYQIPLFSCDPNTEETRSLLSTYEKNRDVIMDAAKQENFLEKFLERIFTTTSNELKLPAISKPKISFDPNNKNEMGDKFAQLALQETNIKGLDHKSLIRSFLKGVDDFQKGTQLKYDYTIDAELSLLPQDLERKKNIEKADELFKNLSTQKNWIPLIENFVVYKTLKEGEGAPATSKMTNLVFHFSIRSPETEELLDAGTVTQGKIDALIPGIAHTLLGMKRGEERTVHIHPSYAYGFSLPYPNQAIVANIQLVEFKEGHEELSIASPIDLYSQTNHIMTFQQSEKDPERVENVVEWDREFPKEPYKELLKKYQELKEKQSYFSGYRFCNLLKTHGISMDYETFKQSIQTYMPPAKLKLDEPTTSYLADFKAYLFHVEKSMETPPRSNLGGTLIYGKLPENK
jgi:FKBP-type peptidyl-prolyl cis-trans isomerase